MTYDNFEVESRKIEFGIPVEMLDFTEDLTPVKEEVSFDIDIKNCHLSAREGLPF